MRLLILLALIGAGAWFGPQFAEGTDDPCPALEHRVAELAQTQAGKVAGAFSSDPRVAQLMGSVKGVANASGGAIAQAYIRDRFPQLPPGVACAASWWKLKFDPDLGPYLSGMLKR